MMGISTQTITVDLSKQLTRPQVVRLGQGDKLGTTLVADIHDNGVAYNLTGKTARFSMRAPDGTASYSVTASSYSGNKATFNIDETYAASVAGKTDTAYVEILSGSTVICSTSRITVVVYRSASQGLPVSGAYSDALEEAIAAANAAIEAMGDISELAVPEMTSSIRGGAKLGTGLAVVDGALGVDLSNVNTGVLPVAHGGTGLTASPSALVDLASSTSASIMQASPRPGVMGTLPIANGGTGATTASDARTNLSVYSKAEVGQNYATKTEVGQKADSSTVLYSNASGSNGTITLSESSANYNHMRIYFRTDDGAAYVSSCDVHSPDGKRALLSAARTVVAQNATWLKTRIVSISGTSITTESTFYATTNVTASDTFQKVNNVYITRIEAWNE